ncbi:MAG: hypothetical protein LBK58_14930 [Prevotellaceae bacterium]|nr:hypothetical protein [Prevotellaceae bacterium]
MIEKQNISIMHARQLEAKTSKLHRELFERISQRYVEGQEQAVRSVNKAIVETDWHIGQYIVEYDLVNETR